MTWMTPFVLIDDPNNEVKNCCDSLYISIEEVENVLKQNDNKFSILSFNIQSLNSKYDSLSIFLSQLYDKNLKFKAICLQETWLSADYDISIFNIVGISYDTSWEKMQPALWFNALLIWWILVYH